MSEPFNEDRKLDHSQWGEQGIILDFFDGFVGKFLDIGAYDGLTGSNSRGLTDRDWSGVCIEASPWVFRRLVENHFLNEKVVCVNAAVMPTVGIVRFFETDSQKSTCINDNKLGDDVKFSYHVAAITPAVIAATFGAEWDFISIDIEGMDLPVIKEMGPLLSQTKLICVEDGTPNIERNSTYYLDLLRTLRDLGFGRVVGRTTTEKDSANTLLTRA